MKHGRKYILDADGNPVPEADLITWAEWFGAAHATGRLRVAYNSVGEIEVSTVFLGLDHAFFGDKPILFETMVFGVDILGQNQWRYSTRAEALEGHQRVCQEVLPREVSA